jgi:hypothetical protein
LELIKVDVGGNKILYLKNIPMKSGYIKNNIKTVMIGEF